MSKASRTPCLFLSVLAVCARFLTCTDCVFAADGEGVAKLVPVRSEVNTIGTWTVSYTVGSSGIAEKGAIKVQFPPSWFMHPFPLSKAVQIDHPRKNHYVTAKVSRQTVKSRLTIDNVQLTGQPNRYSKLFVVRVEQGKLQPGDTVTVVFGDTSGHQNLGTNSPDLAEEQLVRVGTDADGDGTFAEIARPLDLNLVHGPITAVQIILPSVVTSDQPAEARVVLLDAYDNAGVKASAVVTLASTDPKAEFPAHVTFSPADNGIKGINVKFKTLGFQQLRVEGVSESRAVGSAAAVVKCATSAPQEKLYWGDMHSHSAWSFDGYGSHPFEYARDVAFLDFYANTEHNKDDLGGAGVTPKEWEQIRSQVREFYQPGRFVTFLAFEATFGSNFAHHNVFYRDVDQMIYPLNEYDTIQKLWNVLENKQAFTIPHHLGIRFTNQLVESAHRFVWKIYRWEDLTSQDIGGVAIDWKFRNEKQRRALEIYSTHGQSELYDPSWSLSYENAGFHPGVSVPGPHYARDGWADGQHMGVIASTDNHSAQPGQRYGGLAAVWAPQLTRESIWDAFYERKTYGTTGERIWLEFFIDGHPMGQEFVASEKPEIRVTVAGTDDLSRVEIVKYDFQTKKYSVIHKSTPADFLAEIRYRDEAFDHDSFYYVRARQKTLVHGREVWAWSSPIWVRRAQTAQRNYFPLALALLPGLVLIRRARKRSKSNASHGLVPLGGGEVRSRL
ncbi:MAG: DUF3604 domain-containing protein [Acidobacteria bacterium]|nr:DUF3604 domain-containing protein [Acidobacteriota bacterium]